VDNHDPIYSAVPPDDAAATAGRAAVKPDAIRSSLRGCGRRRNEFPQW